MTATAVERDPLEMQVRERPLPAHVGIIMDGNGRWAEERGPVSYTHLTLPTICSV